MGECRWRARYAPGAMPASCIAIADLLDPRDARESLESAIEGAVAIPAPELAARLHELPPPYAVVRIADVGAAANEAAQRLRSMGRSAEIVSGWRHARSAVSADAGHSPARLWRPAEWLEETLPGLSPGGRALDLACGSGRNAVFAASCGWRVTAVDILGDALARGRALAERYAGCIEPVEWRQVDLERDESSSGRTRTADTDNAGSGLGGPFDLVLAFRYLHRPLMPKLAEWLRPGGHVMIETFTTLHRERHGRPSRDAFVLEPGELPLLLPAFEVEQFTEDWRTDGAHTARLLAHLPSSRGTRTHPRSP